MNILLLQLDGRFPNLALMRISAHHKERGDSVTFRIVGNTAALQRGLFDNFDKVYASAIFDRSRPLAQELLRIYPHAIIGGSGWDRQIKTSDVGVITHHKDYSLYPSFNDSIGFTQRGCRLSCAFCCVPEMEGRPWAAESIQHIWRGHPYPKNLILWDNDTFGNKNWRGVFREIRDGGFRVSFNQGINARLLDEEGAEALAALDCYATDFKTRRIYTAWDNRKDEEILFRGLRWLVKYGVKPDNILVYMLCGYWAGETQADREYRRVALREFGVRPYPMPYIRTRELVGMQRWVVGAYDKRIAWADWAANNYRPEGLAVAS